MSIGSERNEGIVPEQALGVFLREAREDVLGPKSLGKFSRLSGIDKAYISKVETGEVKASLRLLSVYSEMFDLAMFNLYMLAGRINVNLSEDSRELLQDWFNEGNIVLKD